MRFIFCFLFLVTLCCRGQYLNVPPRQATMLTGSQFTAQIVSLSLTARENSIYNEVISGNVPDFSRTLTPVTSTALIGGLPKSVTYYVIPDYLAIGSNADYFLCPMSPMLATKIADSLGCTLPTRKMVNDIYAQATLTMTPLTIAASGTMTTVQAFAQHNGMVKTQRNGFIPPYSLGALVAGDKKDVVISNLIYNTPSRVVIYGWHTSVGNPIQPLSNVHADTYMDYSHGIRLVQNSVMYNGTPTTIKALLTGTLNAMLSDEGAISPPQYPYSNVVSSLNIPISFALINKTNNTLEIKVKNCIDATHYKVYLSSNGSVFGAPQTFAKTNLTLTSLVPGQSYYVKIAAYNSTYSVTSGISEVLAAVPCNFQDTLLIVNGFDRAVTGNTYDFVRQHGAAAYANGHYFSSATNEALVDGVISMSSYKMADWILGKESTVNETFSGTEQTLVSNYLKQGGYLFTSGSEVGWDLDNNGSAADKSFYNNYLKSSYVADAPNGQASVWYKVVKDSAINVFTFNDTCVFDNGSNGTYNVDYPDVINPLNGSVPVLRFTNNTTSHAGVAFTGLFPAGTSPGKLVYLTFPFETITSGSKSTTMFEDIWKYFFPTVITSVRSNASIDSFNVFPNPARNLLYVQAAHALTELQVFDLSGQMLFTAKNSSVLNIESLEPGVYFLMIKSAETTRVHKFIKE